jgi:hypothetical protein
LVGREVAPFVRAQALTFVSECDAWQAWQDGIDANHIVQVCFCGFARLQGEVSPPVFICLRLSLCLVAVCWLTREISAARLGRV